MREIVFFKHPSPHYARACNVHNSLRTKTEMLAYLCDRLRVYEYVCISLCKRVGFFYSSNVTKVVGFELRSVAEHFFVP